MQTHFYSHLVEIETISIKLTEIELDAKERQELLDIAHDTIHHHVMDTILDELNESDKKHFLKLLVHEAHDDLWQHLKAKIENAEGKIKSTIQHIKKELYQDIDRIKHENSKL